jgi:hypothetical protein
MSMPGFTAEASLYKANKFYQRLDLSTDSKEIVNPAFGLCRPGCLPRCRSMGKWVCSRSEDYGACITLWSESCREQCCIGFESP